MRRGHLRRASASTPSQRLALRTSKSECKFDRGRRRFTTAREPHIDSAPTEWFSELTEKAWRLYFSREEQAAINELLWKATEKGVIYTEHSAVSLQSGKSRARELSYSPSRIPKTASTLPPVQMAPSQALETFFDESQDNGRDEKRTSRSRRPSFLKTLSIISDSRRTSIDATAEALSPTSPRRRRSFSFTRRSSAPVIEEPLPPSQYYQDPEARMKLKMFLASPQNFDEALELGFPSSARAHTPCVATRRPSIPKVPNSSANNDVQTFLKDASFFDDDDDDDDDNDNNDDDDEYNKNGADNEAAVGEYVVGRRNFADFVDLDSNADDDDDDGSLPDSADSPITPHDKIERLHDDPRSIRAGADKLANGAPRKPQAIDETVWSGNREMTLRMTLTKPELRAPEEQLHGRQRSGRQDPLALEALPSMQDHSALRAHGRKPGTNQEGNKVRGLWKKMRTGSRG